MVYLIYDAVIVLILLFFALRGRTRGLVLALCSLLAVLTAFWGAGVLADALTPKAVELVLPKITAIVEQRLSDSGTDLIGGTVQDGSQPADSDDAQTTDPASDGSGVLSSDTAADDSASDGGAVQTFLNTLNLPDGVRDSVDKAMQNLEALDQLPAAITAAIAQATAETLVHLVIFLASFVLILLVWFVVSHALDLVARLPVLHFFNRTGGFLLGLGKGAALLFLAAWLLRYLGGIIPEDAVERTYLLRFFMTTNPLDYLTGI